MSGAERRRPVSHRYRPGLWERVDRWWVAAAASGLWAWVTYEAALLQLPVAVVITTGIATATAAAAGYLAGRRP